MLECLGNPTDLTAKKCSESMKIPVYESTEISWKVWTIRVKHALLRHLYDEFATKSIKGQPTYKHIQVFQSLL